MSNLPSSGPQFLTALSATMGAFSIGTNLGYSSPAGPLLSSGVNNLELGETELSWFSSSATLGALIGGLVGGYLMNTFGRRGAMLVSIPPALISWGLIGGAQNFSMLIIGRLLAGTCMGIHSVSIPTYIGEFASKNVRGTLGSVHQLMAVTGVLYVYSIGAAFDNFRYIALACAIIPVIFGVGMFFNHESPTFLIFKGKEDECKKALQYFRGPHYDITSEYEVLKKTMEENKKKTVSFRDLKHSYVLKPLFISLFIMIFQQVCGINAVIFNLDTIFAGTGTSMSESLSSIIFGIVQVIATFAAVLLMDKLGRKVLLILSDTFMMLSLIALGVYFYMLDQDPDKVDGLGWLPLTSLLIFIAAFSIGFGPVPWLMMSELFSSDIRDMASSLATSTNWTFAFVITVTFQSLQNAIHDYGAYWLFFWLLFH